MEFKKGDWVKINPSGRSRFRDNNFGGGYGVVEGVHKGSLPYEVQWAGGEFNCYGPRDLDPFHIPLENI